MLHKRTNGQENTTTVCEIKIQSECQKWTKDDSLLAIEGKVQVRSPQRQWLKC